GGLLAGARHRGGRGDGGHLALLGSALLGLAPGLLGLAPGLLGLLLGGTRAVLRLGELALQRTDALVGGGHAAAQVLDLGGGALGALHAGTLGGLGAPLGLGSGLLAGGQLAAGLLQPDLQLLGALVGGARP